MGDRYGYRFLGGVRVRKFIAICTILLIFSPVFLRADEAADSIARLVDDLFMKASSGEVQFRDLVEPSKEALIEMGIAAVPQMITKLPTEDARERHTVEDIFKGIADPAVPALIEALYTENLYQLRLAAGCLGKIGNRDATQPLLQFFWHQDHSVRSAAVTAVGDIKDSSAVGEIIKKLEDEAETVRKSAAVSLGKIAHADAISPLITALDDPHYSVRYSAAGSLVKIGDQAGKVLLEDYSALSNNAIGYACDVWAQLKYKKACKQLEKILKENDDRYLRGFAIVALAQIDSPKARKYIRKNIEKENDLFVLSSFEKAYSIISESE